MSVKTSWAIIITGVFGTSAYRHFRSKTKLDGSTLDRHFHVKVTSQLSYDAIGMDIKIHTLFQSPKNPPDEENLIPRKLNTFPSRTPRIRILLCTRDECLMKNRGQESTRLDGFSWICT